MVRLLVLLFGENPHAVVGVVEKSPPPPLTGEQYGKMELRYPARVFYVLRVFFNVPLYFK